MRRFIYTKNQIADIPQFSVGIAESILNDEYEVQFVYKNRKVILSKEKVYLFDPLKTGDGYPYKVCNVCHRYLPTEQFSRNQNSKGNRIIRRPSCDECHKIIDGESICLKEKREWNKIKPSMQIWECPICRKRTIPDLTSKVVLDHDHKTGKVRGWICDSCNTGIGRFKDEIELLQQAIDFIRAD